MRFEEKEATVSYLPGKTTLARILRPYDDTPFTVTQAEPVVSVVRAGGLLLKGWTERLVVEKPVTGPRPAAGKAADPSNPPTIRLVVELAASR